MKILEFGHMQGKKKENIFIIIIILGFIWQKTTHFFLQ